MNRSTPACLVAIAFALFAPLATGCAAIAGDQTADMTFQVKPRPDDTFHSWNVLTVSGTGGVTDATLLSVTFDTVDPPNTPDMTYVTSIVGTGTSAGEPTQFCDASDFPSDTPDVVGDVTFRGNIVPYFEGDSIRIDWTGTINPEATFPDGGFTVRARLQVSPQ